MVLEQPDINPNDQAEFNSALAFLQRLNEMEYVIESSLINWDLQYCFFVLQSYENELCFKFKPEEQEDVNEITKDIEDLMEKYPRINLTLEINGVKKYRYSIERYKLRNLLIKLNKELRKLKQNYGMGMPSKSEGRLF